MLTDNPAAPQILVVEDDNSHALLIQRAFEDAPQEYRLERVTTLHAAKTAIEQHSPGLVLTDYQLPDGEGIEMMSLVNGACPVIIMTSHGNEQIAVEAMKVGVQDYIVKSPEIFEALPRIVRRSLSEWILIQDQMLSADALRKSEAKQRAMIENIVDVIAIIDKDGINRYKSPNVEKWFGWQTEEVVGEVAWNNVHPDDMENTRQAFGSMLTEAHVVKTGECRYRCKDGSYKWIEYTGVNLLHDPDISGVLLSYHDISERKQAQEEKNKLESQLQHAQKMESVGRLAGGVAHDFNNMLTVILGHAELGIMKLDPAHPVIADLKEISKTAQRSADLTRQLLAFARKQTVSPKVIDLNETVSGMLKMLQRLIGEDIHLTWQPSASLWPVNIDPAQIDQILANLCVNARDAIEDTGLITIETINSSIDADYCTANPEAMPGEYVCLSVSDDGGGMDKETQSHIFEPFYTTKELGKGTGLGLATVYGAVKQNNGFVNVYSEPGQGTSFSIYLPRHEGHKIRTLVDGVALPIPRGKETILLVEDEPAILNITAMMLEKQGYTVLKAATSGEAINFGRKHVGEIHLLMTDVIMPEMNGRDLAKNLISLYPGMKRLFMSGYTADIITHHGVLDAGVHFIQKPFSLLNMAAMVREVLDEV